MIKVEELQRERASLVKERSGLVTAAETREEGSKNLTEDEEKRFNSLTEQIKGLDGRIERAKIANADELAALQAKNDPNKNGSRSSGDEEDGDELNPDGKNGFRSLADFLIAVRDGKTDGLETRDTTAGNGPSMGYLIPKKFDDQLRSIAAKPRIARSLATIIPAGDKPDEEFELLSLDQTGDKGVYGGVVMQWTAEGEEVNDAGDPKLIPITLKPQELTGKMTLTNKMLRNGPAASTLLSNLMLGAKDAAEEDAFFNGDGTGKPHGMKNSPARLTVPRKTADSVTYEDLTEMYAKLLGENGVWVINKSVLPTLQQLVAPNTNVPAWQPSAREGEPSTILGLPVRYNEFSPVKGVEGDIALYDMKYYAIKDGSQLAIAIDPYTGMGSGKTKMYLFWNVDGQSMLTGPMVSQDGITKTSPFIILTDKTA